jgi:hypothetical protein
MKKMKLIHSFRIIACLLLSIISVAAQAQADSTAKPTRQSLLYLQYHAINNEIPFLVVQTKNKLENAFLPAADVPVTIYMDNDLVNSAVVGKLVTDEKGEGRIGIPTSLAQAWNQHNQHSFFAHTDSSAAFASTDKSVNVTIAKLVLDTAAGGNGKALVATLVKKENGSWLPVPNVDLKISVKRLGGNLNVSENETYTTDSVGKATAEFQLDQLPGNASGNLEAVAFIDDNDEVGTLQTSLTIPWGKPTVYKSQFGERSLWATGTKAPIWLMLMAYGCIIAVWSVIIYLITRIRLISILGREKK